MVVFEPLDEHLRTHTEAIVLMKDYQKTLNPKIFSCTSFLMGSRPKLFNDDIGFPTMIYFSDRYLYPSDFGMPLHEPVPLDDLAGFLGGKGKEHSYLTFDTALKDGFPYFDVFFTYKKSQVLAHLCITKYAERAKDPWHILLTPEEIRKYGVAHSLE